MVKLFNNLHYKITKYNYIKYIKILTKLYSTDIITFLKTIDTMY